MELLNKPGIIISDKIIKTTKVKKYIDKSFVPVVNDEIIHFDREKDFPKSFNDDAFVNIDNYGDLCVLTENEIIGIKLLWKEITV